MTKKIIALALFVAMLVALVPVASAAYTDVNILTGPDEIWYAKAVNEKLAASGNIIGVYGSGKGVAVKLSGEDGKKIDITITGKYSDLQSYYYDYTGNTSVYGKAVKIPFEVLDSNLVDVTANSTVNGGTTYYAGYITAGGDRVYYLNFALVEGGNSATYRIKYQNNDSYTVNVKFVDSDGITTTNGTAAKLEVIGIAGLQKNNFRAEYANGSYVEPSSANSYKGYYDDGTLTYYIAAMTKTDRTAIYETGLTQKTGTTPYMLSPTEIAAIIASLGEGEYVQPGSFSSSAYYTYYITDPTRGEMTARLKAFDENGVAYPAGTIVLLKDKGTLYAASTDGYSDWNEDYLGYSEKFVNVDGKATYLVDRDNAFAFTVRGIVWFSMSAGSKTSNDNVYLYKKTMAKDIVLQFVKTNTGAEQSVKFDLVFQNIDRTTSGLTLLAEEMEVVVGDTVQIPYIIDNPYALSTALKSPWVSTNDKVVAVTDDDEGYIKAKAAGKAYVYCTDAAGKVKLVIVNAVATATTTPPVEVVTPSVTKYVVTASRLNFREGPATSYKSLGLIERNTVVEGVEAPANGWVKISYKGQVGYCSGKYLAEID